MNLLLSKRSIISALRAVFSSFIILLFWYPAISQSSLPDNFCISADEMQLFDRVNNLRRDYDKKVIQLSSSLSYVAKIHTEVFLESLS